MQVTSCLAWVRPRSINRVDWPLSFFKISPLSVASFVYSDLSQEALPQPSSLVLFQLEALYLFPTIYFLPLLLLRGKCQIRLSLF